MRALRVATLLLIGCLAGCGRSGLQQAKVVGLTAKQTAEAAYLVVRVEYLQGRVDEAAMEKARSLYACFFQAQAAYVNALRLWEAGSRPTDLDQLKRDVTTLAADLHALALAVTEKNQRRGTTPSAGGSHDA